MSRRVIVLRPAPGNAATLARLRAARLDAVALPLFAVEPLPWSPPPPAAFDALVLTSANALRHGGSGLAALTGLPVLAIGPATAQAARDAGFTIRATGSRGLAALLARIDPETRLLWLAGQDRTAIDHPALAQVIPVYRSAPLPIDAAAAARLIDGVALLHSARAAALLAAALDRHALPRARVRLAAISAKVAAAAGPGWAGIATAAHPSDDALIATARALAIDP